MINSVSSGSWFQFQSLARSVQSLSATTEDRSASPGSAAQPGTAPETRLGTKPTDKPADKPTDNPGTRQLTSSEQKEVEDLKQRDKEVRIHEQTHKAQLGPYATGGPFYEYTTGPDNKQYAVGGSVSVDISKESTPEKTIQKAQVIKRASMAVASPSGADKAVASKAQRMEQQARAELTKEKQQERKVSRELGAYQQAASAEETASQSFSRII